MTELFLKVLSMSLSSLWLFGAVVLLRLALKRSPKWIHVLLWALVAIRLVCPVSFESISLVPGRIVVRTNTGTFGSLRISSFISVKSCVPSSSVGT